MRTWMLTTAAVVALLVGAGNPTDAKAQVIVSGGYYGAPAYYGGYYAYPSYGGYYGYPYIGYSSYYGGWRGGWGGWGYRGWGGRWRR